MNIAYRLPEKFNTLKFKRTYVDGSESKEEEKAKKYVGEPDEYGICRNVDHHNVIEICHTVYLDKTHVLYSWKKRVEEIKMVFMILSFISFILYNSGSLLSLIMLISSVVLFIGLQIIETVLYFKKRKDKDMHDSVIALSLLHLKYPDRDLY